MLDVSQDLCRAIKELVNEQLKETLETQSKLAQQQDDAMKAIQDLSGKIVEREQDATKLRESFDKFQEDSEASRGKSEGNMNEELTSVKARLDKFEDDADGIGGLKQVWDKCNSFTKSFEEMQPKLEEDSRLAKECTTRTEEFDRKMRDLSRQCSEFLETVNGFGQRLKDVEGISRTVGSAQESLEDSVTRKYEVLWKDILNALEEVKRNQLDVLMQELANQRDGLKSQNSSMVKYAMDYMAKAHAERQQLALNKSLMLAWKDQTWNSARRRLGISYLHKIAQRRNRMAFDTWHRRHCTNVLCERLHGQYEGQLSDVYKEIKEGDSALSKRCDKLDVGVKTLTDEKCTKKSLQDSVEKLQKGLQDELKVLGFVQSTLTDHGKTLQQHADLHKSQTGTNATLDAKISGIGRDIADLVEGCKIYAKNEEVQSMVRDVLLVWNSIKQLDTAKADKKDVDSFALETLNRDKLATRRLEDLEADLTSKSRQETQRDQEKWLEVEGRLDETGRQFRHWEQMWEKLSGFVEDLVAKIGDLQNTDKAAATLRAPVRHSSRDRLLRGRADAPTIPVNNSGPDHGLQQAGRPDPKTLWINSAKGIVDATIDQALNPANTAAPTGMKSRARPKSATAAARRPLDRAM